MRIRSARRRALAAAVLVAALSVLGACGNGGETAPEATTPSSQPSSGPATTAAPSEQPAPPPAGRSLTIRVRNGAVVGGPARVQARAGEQLRIVVDSDVADEVHVHGYERRAQVAAGGQATVALTADIPGVFEIELEKSKVELGELVVKG